MHSPNLSEAACRVSAYAEKLGELRGLANLDRRSPRLRFQVEATPVFVLVLVLNPNGTILAATPG